MATSKTVKRILIAVMLLGFAGVVAAFMTFRRTYDTPGKLAALLPENTQVSMGAFEHTASQDGRTQWHLEAKSANLTDGKKKLVLQTPAVVFYRENGTKIYLTAETGILQTQTNNITMSGNVVARTEGYRFEAEAAEYDHHRRYITSRHRLKLPGSSRN